MRENRKKFNSCKKKVNIYKYIYNDNNINGLIPKRL